MYIYVHIYMCSHNSARLLVIEAVRKATWTTGVVNIR